MHFSSLAAAAAVAATAEAALVGFNYGSTLSDGSAKTQADFEAEFLRAQDLQGTNGEFTSARLYTMIQSGTTDTPIYAIPAAIDTQTSLLLGLWASAGQTDFTDEITALTSAITEYGTDFTSLIVGISVGSEDLYRNTVTGEESDAGAGANPDTLVDYIKQVKAAIADTDASSATIGHVDTWTAWVNSSNSAVIEACDWIGMDAYPYFQNTEANGIDVANATFWDAYEETVAVADGKDVWVSETGWPVSGETENDAVASTANAEIYWQQTGCSLFNNINTFWYILQDALPTVPSPSFGIVGSDLASDPLYNLTCSNGALGSSSTSSSASSSATSSAVTTVSSVTAPASATGTNTESVSDAAPAAESSVSVSETSAASSAKSTASSAASSAAVSSAASAASSVASSVASETSAASAAASAASSATSESESAAAATSTVVTSSVVVSGAVTHTAYSTTLVTITSCSEGCTTSETSVAAASVASAAASSESAAAPTSTAAVSSAAIGTAAPSLAVSSATTAAAASTSASSTSCPADLDGEYQYPHLIIPVNKDEPETAYGTQYNGTFTPTVSTIFNFDIPADYAGKTCSLVFLFPEQDELETSAFTFNGEGGISVNELASPATEETTYDTVPSVSVSAIGTIASAAPGNSYVLASYSCDADTTQAFEFVSTGGLELEYFEDYNPSPIGAYITVC